MTRYILAALCFSCMVLGTLSACGGSSDDQDPEINPLPIDSSLPIYENPQAVNLIGYTGDAMEPYISRDGNILFFNNLNAASLANGAVNDTDLHYATRIDDVNFSYMGRVFGASTDLVSDENELEGVASMDDLGQFYFVRTIDYLDPQSPNYLRSLFRADYSDGGLSNLQSISNLKFDRPSDSPPQLGELNFDAEIHREGNQLYFVQGLFSGNPYPDAANIGLAHKTDNNFVVDENSETLFAAINSDDLEYAPAISDDQLTLFFTRGSGNILTGFEFGIYLATRNSAADPWGNVTQIAAINGELTEGPSITANETHLYYHQKENGVFKIYVVSRQSP